jgi:hypothetical protein
MHASWRMHNVRLDTKGVGSPDLARVISGTVKEASNPAGTSFCPYPLNMSVYVPISTGYRSPRTINYQVSTIYRHTESSVEAERDLWQRTSACQTNMHGMRSPQSIMITWRALLTLGCHTTAVPDHSHTSVSANLQDCMFHWAACMKNWRSQCQDKTL